MSFEIDALERIADSLARLADQGDEALKFQALIHNSTETAMHALLMMVPPMIMATSADAKHALGLIEKVHELAKVHRKKNAYMAGLDDPPTIPVKEGDEVGYIHAPGKVFILGVTRVYPPGERPEGAGRQDDSGQDIWTAAGFHAEESVTFELREDQYLKTRQHPEEIRRKALPTSSQDHPLAVGDWWLL